jgi:hypothetical protein
LLNAVVVWFLARDVFGVAWGATTDAEMVVFEVALISNAAEYADCYEENIIIIYLNGGCRFCCGCAVDNRDLREGRFTNGLIPL